MWLRGREIVVFKLLGLRGYFRQLLENFVVEIRAVVNEGSE